MVGDDRWKWKIDVKSEPKNYIKSVKVQLHSSFKPSDLTLSSAPFELKRVGWGTFPVKFEVKLSTGAVIRATHALEFGSGRVETIVDLCDSATEAELDTATPLLTPEEALKWHGVMGDVTWPKPRMVERCDEEARPGYTSMSASEYQEHPDVFKSKVKILAELVLKSQNLAAYTGAGISTAAGIGDYGTKSKSRIAERKRKLKGKSAICAIPTKAHHALAALHKCGHLKHWVNQNHDGLPQKAGFPEHMVNDIHGSWFDPSNPVVPMSGTLRDDLYEWLNEWSDRADLVLAMGSSLCGMSADCMVTDVSERAADPADDTGAIGAVIVSLQQTQYDEISCLRFFCTIDRVMKGLLEELAIPMPPLGYVKPTLPPGDVFDVPYDFDGKLGGHSVLDLSTGSKLRVQVGQSEGTIATVIGKNSQGNYRVKMAPPQWSVKKKRTGTRVYAFGAWWVEAAIKGTIPFLPLVNVHHDGPN